jgi:hypothetical protein
METKLTFNLLPVIAVLISLLAWYIPGFNKWYGALEQEQKQLLMVGCLFAVTLVVVGLSALGFLSVYAGPTWREWIWYPLVDFVAAVIINTGTYKATNYMLGGRMVLAEDQLRRQ